MSTMKRMAVVLAVAGCATAMAQPAVNGELRDLKGSVMVLKGKDYVAGAAGMTVAAGERVLVLERAHAKLVVSSNGERCEIDLKENQSVTLAPQGCKALLASVQTVPGGGAPGAAAVAAGGAAAVAGASAAGGAGAVTGAGVAAGAAAGAAMLGGTAAISGGALLTQRNKASND